MVRGLTVDNARYKPDLMHRPGEDIYAYEARLIRERRMERAIAGLNQEIRIYEAWLAQIEKQKEDGTTSKRAVRARRNHGPPRDTDPSDLPSLFD